MLTLFGAAAGRWAATGGGVMEEGSTVARATTTTTARSSSTSSSTSGAWTRVLSNYGELLGFLLKAWKDSSNGQGVSEQTSDRSSRRKRFPMQYCVALYLTNFVSPRVTANALGNTPTPVNTRPTDLVPLTPQHRQWSQVKVWRNTLGHTYNTHSRCPSALLPF